MVPAAFGLEIVSWNPVVTTPPRLLKLGPLRTVVPLSRGSQPRALNWFKTTLVRAGTKLLVIALTAFCQSFFVNGVARLESPQRADSAATALPICWIRGASRALTDAGV